MYILALNGSHNNDGNTAFLLNEILRHCAEKGAETEICSVSEAIMDTKTPFCVACSTPCTKKCYKDTKLDTLFDKIERADFVVFGSPVYFGSMTGQMKCFFDKTRDARANKKVARKAYGGGNCRCVKVRRSGKDFGAYSFMRTCFGYDAYRQQLCIGYGTFRCICSETGK